MRENGRERRGLSRDGGTKGRGNREGCNQIRQSSSAYTLTLDTLWVWKGLSLGCNRAGKGGEGLWGIVLGAWQGKAEASIEVIIVIINSGYNVC